MLAVQQAPCGDDHGSLPGGVSQVPCGESGMKVFQRKHISDQVVKEACEERLNDPTAGFLTDIIMRRTGAPEKVVMAKLLHCDRRHMTDFGVSLRTGYWIAD